MHPEDLKPGDWILIRGYKPPSWIDDDPYQGQMNACKQHRISDLSGYPYQVKAIQLPFVALERTTQDPPTVTTMGSIYLVGPQVSRPIILDTREADIVRADPEYVNAFHAIDRQG